MEAEEEVVEVEEEVMKNEEVKVLFSTTLKLVVNTPNVCGGS